MREALNGLAMMGVDRDPSWARRVRRGAAADPAGRGRSADAATEVITPELLEARRIVEVELARLAAERRTEEDLAAMQESWTTQRADWKTGRPVVQASQFHLLVADAAEEPDPRGRGAAVLPLVFELGPQLYQTTEGYAHGSWSSTRGSAMAIAVRATASWRDCACWNTSPRMDPHYRGTAQPTAPPRRAHASCSSPHHTAQRPVLRREVREQQRHPFGRDRDHPL